VSIPALVNLGMIIPVVVVPLLNISTANHRSLVRKFIESLFTTT
jgi:hypothetical protein